MPIYRSKAPLRLGLAGGGTDVSPYSDLYGGCILNATINLYAYATIIPSNDHKIVLIAQDRQEVATFDMASQLPINGKLDLLKGVYNRLINQFNLPPLSFQLHTFVDAPAGSGLGTSSTLVVAIIGAFAEWLQLPLGEYDIAHLAYEIERVDLAMSGGKQDQYAATFGGFNFMEFYKDDKVIVNPLRIRSQYLYELEQCMLLYYTGVSRVSATIIESQVQNVNRKENKSVEAMHMLKEQAQMMKEALLKGELHRIGEVLNFGWEFKKQMSAQISNSLIDEVYHAAINAGANGGKISGAGGGGFMFFYCPEHTKYSVSNALLTMGGVLKSFQFVEHGLVTWRTN